MLGDYTLEDYENCLEALRHPALGLYKSYLHELLIIEENVLFNTKNKDDFARAQGKREGLKEAQDIIVRIELKIKLEREKLQKEEDGGIIK